MGTIAHSVGFVGGVVSSAIRSPANLCGSAGGHRVYRERECVMVAKDFSSLAAALATVDGQVAQAQRDLTRARALRGAVERLRGHGKSAGGEVTATVNQAGALTAIQFSTGASGVSLDRLAELVVEASRQAHRDAANRYARLMHETFGADSATAAAALAEAGRLLNAGRGSSEALGVSALQSGVWHPGAPNEPTERSADAEPRAAGAKESRKPRHVGQPGGGLAGLTGRSGSAGGRAFRRSGEDDDEGGQS